MSWIKGAGLLLAFLLFALTAWLERSFSFFLVAIALAVIFLMVISRRTPAVGTIAISTLLSIAAADFAVGAFLVNEKKSTFYDPDSDYTQGYSTRDTDLGYQPNPGVHSSRKVASDDSETIYDVVYTVGPDGFRSTPSNEDKPISINLFGGSFTYGEGLNDKETLPYYLSETLGLGVKNYGVHGYGMHQALAILQRDVPPKGKINIFLTAPWHALRSACKPGYAVGTPRYALVDNALIRDGVCPNQTGLPGAGVFGRILNHSNIFKYFNKSKANTGVITPNDLDLYFAIMNKAYQLSRSRGQKVMIAFIKARSDRLEESGQTNQSIIQKLKGASDSLVDVTLADTRSKLDQKYYIHELDQHPSAIANLERAELIKSALTGSRLLTTGPPRFESPAAAESDKQ